MKSIAPFFLLIILASLFPPLPRVLNFRDRGRTISRTEQYAIRCSPGNADAEFHMDSQGKFIGPLPGWGNHQYAISSTNDSARFYFNQALSLYYSYHPREAVASFREAAHFDTTSAIAYWGEALAMGPNYNRPHYEMPKWLPAVLESMNKYAPRASPKEKQLIRVMNKRYSANSSVERKILNREYAQGMQSLIQEYPEDLDIQALYVDAVMLEHAWDFWFNNGKAKAWTPELTRMCEHILQRDPHHPGAMHYYIHVTEASRSPEKALRFANQLKDQMPGVAHMVHMSSHVYERTGHYVQGVRVNDKADEDINLYDSLANNLNLGRGVSHYYAVQTFCAIGGAMYKEGMPKAFRCRNSVNPTHDNTNAQYIYMFPVLAWTRMGKWDEILAEPDPDKSWSYACILNDFAKGLASLRKGNREAAIEYLNSMAIPFADSTLQVRDIPFNRPIQTARIARDILQGEIQFSKKEFEAAIQSFEVAIREEDSLIYVEPKDWLLPARQFLGTRLLDLHRVPDAARTFRQDLVWNPGNGWSSLGLYQCLMAEHKPDQAARLKAAFLAAFSGADKIPESAVY